MRRFLAVPVLVLAAAAGGVPAQSLPSTPDPSLCVVDPRPAAFFEPLVEQVVAPGNVATPEPVKPGPTPPSPSEGSAASEATVDEVVDLLLQAVACNNARDFPRLAALFTDRGARDAVLTGWSAGTAAVQNAGDGSGRQLSPRDLLDTILRVGPPVPEPQRAGLIQVTDVREHPDGQVTALVVRSLFGGQQITTRWEFERVDGDLRLVDESPVEDDPLTPAP